MADGKREKRSRRRAVTLTPGALKMLQDGVAEVSAHDPAERTLTRQARAQLLGVSTLTADRILAGQGVDRATLRLAFESLGLAWDESFCIPLRQEQSPDPPIQEVPEPAAAPLPQAGLSRKNALRRFAQRYAYGGTTVLLVFLAVVVFRGTRRPHHTITPTAPAARLVATTEPNWRAAETRLHLLAADEYHRGDYPPARRHIQEAIALAREHSGYNEMAQALKVFGDLEDERGDLVSAKARYRETLTLWRVAKRPDCAAPVYEAVGELETRTGEWKPAQQDLTEALRLFQNTHDGPGTAMCYRDLGSLAARQRDYPAAERWFQRSLKIAAPLPNGKPIAMDVQGRRAAAFSEQRQYSRARRLLEECLAFWTGQKHPRWIAVCERHLGDVECRSGNVRDGHTLLERSLATFEQLGDKASAAACRSALQRAGS